MEEKYLGEKMPKLGFGFMRLPMLGEEIDIETTKKMVDLFLENGFTYFDTAYIYVNQTAEGALKKVLVDRYPRESFQLTSKLPLDYVKCEEDVEKIFYTSMERLGVEFIDYYLIHALNRTRAQKAEQLDVWEKFFKLKQEGKIKYFGFSFHDKAEILDQVLAKYNDDIDFIQLQLNYLDWESEEIQARKCYEVALKYKKPIIIMEPVKGGILAELPPKAAKLMKDCRPDMSIPSWAVRYCASLENIFTVLSGMSTVEQVLDNMSYMKEVEKLSKEEYQVVDAAMEIIQSIETIPCTDCKYCVPVCPKKIAIPGLFSTANDNTLFGTEDAMPVNMRKYRMRIEGLGKASDCIGCGRCEAQCPQHIPIVKHMAKVGELYDQYI